MSKPKTICYSMLVGDLIHYGHLMMLKAAKESADYHICGVITDEIATKWLNPIICDYNERKTVLESIEYVDRVVEQNSLDPTDVIKNIGREFPDAKILMVKNHILGENSVLGESYIKELGGSIITHDFYSKLSRQNIKKAFAGSFSAADSLDVGVANLSFGDNQFFQNQFSTKADTIRNLRERLVGATIEKEFIFTVKQWNLGKEEIVSKIQDLYSGAEIVVRSSSINEDNLEFSNAGSFESVLNVDSKDANKVSSAIHKVIKSYGSEQGVDEKNQVLVQKQTEDVCTSGVVFTRNLWTNTPYYLINYDDISRDTTTVTSGSTVTKKIEILRGLEIDQVDEKWRKLLTAIFEIEEFFKGLTLDIEFALKNNGEVVIFQVRPLAANSRFDSSNDEETISEISKAISQLKNKPKANFLTDRVFYSDMAFWNPAELIGDRPHYLDRSLFNFLLMKRNWNEGLLKMGYTDVGENLMELVAGKPFINVHHAFLSLLPADLEKGLKAKLLRFYNDKLIQNPSLHDKIEFEIVHNCYHFDSQRELSLLLEHGFSAQEVSALGASLKKITVDAVLKFDQIAEQDSQDISDLDEAYTQLKRSISNEDNWQTKLQNVERLIEDCARLGTEQFSRMARMAFIASAFVKSLIKKNISQAGDLKAFMNAIQTVASSYDQDVQLCRKGDLAVDQFIDKYEHLRPGTYDITMLPYGKNKKFLGLDRSESDNAPTVHPKEFDRSALVEVIESHLSESGMNEIQGEQLLNFIEKATQLREYYKFIYTKNISLSLELIASTGESFGLTRKELANLDYKSIVFGKELDDKQEVKNLWSNLIAGRMREKKMLDQLSLPTLIFEPGDLRQVKSYLSKPNYTTDLIVEGEIVVLTGNESVAIDNKIVVIEKADPGFDWIFNRKIKGLITKYGGAASHMAIRCAEFQIPAAIGCGDLLYDKLVSAQSVILNCEAKSVAIL